MRVVFNFLALFLFTISSAFGMLKEVPKEGKTVYIIQVGSVTDIEKAKERLEKFKDLPFARISFRDGRYKVRVGFFKSLKEAKEFAKEVIAKRTKDFYITRIRFTPKDITFASSMKKEEVEKKESSTDTELKPQISVSLEEEETVPQSEEFRKLVMDSENEPYASEENKTNSDSNKSISVEKEEEISGNFSEDNNETEKFSKVEKFEIPTNLSPPTSSSPDQKESFFNGKFFLSLAMSLAILLGLASIPGVFIILRNRRNPLEPKSEDIHKFIAKLLEEGDYEKVLDIGIPYIGKNTEDTFVKKAVAESLEKLGRYLAASAIYEELSRDLEKKGLNVLAKEFEIKSKELAAKEFKEGE
ncbi:MAG: SPOR domain-containing protein [Desulfurobacteriaceae bacterium]